MRKGKRGNTPLFCTRLFEMISVSTIEKALEEKIHGTDLFLVDVAVKPSGQVFVEVDKDPAISISELAGLNRHLERYFEGEADDFDIRVSSPGLDRPLRHARQFAKNIGREVKLVLLDGSSVEGELAGMEEEGLELIIKKKVKGKKELEKSRVGFKIEEIKETRLIVKLK